MSRCRLVTLLCILQSLTLGFRFNQSLQDVCHAAVHLAVIDLGFRFKPEFTNWLVAAPFSGIDLWRPPYSWWVTFDRRVCQSLQISRRLAARLHCSVATGSTGNCTASRCSAFCRLCLGCRFSLCWRGVALSRDHAAVRAAGTDPPIPFKLSLQALRHVVTDRRRPPYFRFR